MQDSFSYNSKNSTIRSFDHSIVNLNKNIEKKYTKKTIAKHVQYTGRGIGVGRMTSRATFPLARVTETDNRWEGTSRAALTRDVPSNTDPTTRV